MNQVKLISIIVVLFFLSCKDKNPTENVPKDEIPNSVSLILKNPLGGEEYLIGDTLLIKWESKGIHSINLHLIEEVTNKDIEISNNINAEDGEFSYKVGTELKGRYRIYLASNEDPQINIMSSNKISIMPELYLSFFPYHVGDYCIQEYHYTSWGIGSNYTEKNLYKREINSISSNVETGITTLSIKIKDTLYNQIQYEKIQFHKYSGLIYINDMNRPRIDLSKEDGVYGGFTDWASGYWLMSIKTDEFEIDNIIYKRKEYYTSDSELGRSYYLIENIGLVKGNPEVMFGSAGYKLKGAYVDGVIYGDITFGN